MADDQCPNRLAVSPADVIERLIFQRRSIRRYRSRDLPDAWVRAILACAHQAPSPSNSQPVRYVRIDSASCREALHRSLDEGHQRLLAEHRAAGAPARLRNWINAYHRYSEFMFTAPVLLAVGVDTGIKGVARRLSEAGLKAGQGDSEPEMDITVGIALQALLLKAQALGVGSCILTAPLIFIQDAQAILGLGQWAVKCFVTLGLAAETPDSPGRLPLADVIRVV